MAADPPSPSRHTPATDALRGLLDVELRAITACALAAAVVAVAGAPLVLRAPLGLLAVLLLPGYTLAGVFFPGRGALSPVERLGLSVGLSFALLTLLAIALDNSRWGLSEVPVVVSLTAWTLAAAALAAWRRSRVPKPEGRTRTPSLRRLIHTLDRGTGRALALLTAALGLALAVLAAVLASPPPPLTEFYVLGGDGLAEGYPRSARVGDTLVLVTGIANHENGPATYFVVARDGTAVLGTAGPVQLEAGEEIELPCPITPLTAGDGRPIVISLYRDGRAAPYRQLRVWIDVGRV